MLRPRVRLLYFFLSIVAIGLPLCAALVLPFYLLGVRIPSARRAADLVMRRGISWLMNVQYWLRRDVRLEIPAGGALVVSNHRSHLDVFLLLAQVPGVRILAKDSLFRIPFLNVMMKASGQIRSTRGDPESFWAAMRRVGERLREGEIVHIFPEMTRCRPGFKGTGGFALAPFKVARDAGRPVVPVVITGSDDLWPRGRLALGHGSVKVTSLEPVDPNAFANAEALRDEVRRRIEEAL